MIQEPTFRTDGLLSARLLFFVVVICIYFFRFVFVFFIHIFPFGYYSTAHALYIEILSIWKAKRALKSQDDRLSPRNSTRELRKFAGSRTSFDGTAWTPCSRSSTPVMVPADIFVHILFLGSENVNLEYLVTVVTGNLKGAGTNASVSLVIKGVNYVALRILRRHSITS